MAPALTTVSGVAIAKVGEWNASSGRWVCTREQLEDAVRAQHDPAFRAPVLKLGHDDPRFEGTPAIGRLQNLRLDASGEVLLADLVGVPTWLAEILPSAYPSRSVEALLAVATDEGANYAMVVTGLALLGVTPPAIESLADIATLYDQPTDVGEWVAAKRVAASLDVTSHPGAAMPTEHQPTDRPSGQPEDRPSDRPSARPSGQAAGQLKVNDTGRPERVLTPQETADAATADGRSASAGETVLGSASIEELVDQARAYAMANGADGWVWTREVYTDHLILDDDAGRLYRLDWSEAGGSFTFGALQPVVIRYEPVADTVAARAAHKVHLPLLYARGRGDVIASTPKEHQPMTEIAAQVRERLGLAEDVDDEAVMAALDSRLSSGQTQAAGTGTTPDPDADGEDDDSSDDSGSTTTTTTTTQASAGEFLTRAQAEAMVAAAVKPLSSTLAATSRELADRKEAERVSHRDALIGGAVKAGKITPADREKWQGMFDASPEGAKAVEAVFASLAKGTAVPVTAAGRAAPEATGDMDDRDYDALFGAIEAAEGVRR